VKADCGPGTSLLSGGVALSGNIVQSRPFDDGDANKLPDDGWRVKGVRESFSGQLLAVAACIQNPAPIQYRSNAGKVKGDGAKTLRANCPRSKAVAGGGFSVGGSPATSFAHSLRPRDSKADAKKVPDDAFEATVVNGSNKQRGAKAYAICLG
jgi:hypothetical protein